MGGREQWMPVSIMQDDQFAAAQDFSAELAYRPSRDEHVTVDRLAMAVHVEHGGSTWLFSGWMLRLPQRPGPLGHCLCQAFGCSPMGQAGEKPFRVALTLSPPPA